MFRLIHEGNVYIGRGKFEVLWILQLVWFLGRDILIRSKRLQRLPTIATCHCELLLLLLCLPYLPVPST